MANAFPANAASPFDNSVVRREAADLPPENVNRDDLSFKEDT